MEIEQDFFENEYINEDQGPTAKALELIEEDINEILDEANKLYKESVSKVSYPINNLTSEDLKMIKKMERVLEDPEYARRLQDKRKNEIKDDCLFNTFGEFEDH